MASYIYTTQASQKRKKKNEALVWIMKIGK